MIIPIVKPVHNGIEAIQDSLSEILNSGMVTNNSKYVQDFENELGVYLNANQKPLCFCNGELALFNLIQAVKISLGYEPSQSFKVLVPSFTFSGTLNALILNNLEPIFCDVNETLTIDWEKIKDNSQLNGVKIILAVGVYGNLPDVEELKQFSEKIGAILIFDNAPAFGSKYKGKYVNNYHIDEIYSFHATKIFSTMEGGMAISNNSTINEILYNLRDFGQTDKIRGNVSHPGLNSKMQEISAIVGINNFKNFDRLILSRGQVIDKYNIFFKELEHKNKLKTMVVHETVICNYLYYPIILTEEATRFVSYMKNCGIGVRRYYTAVHTLSYYKGKYEELDLSFTNSIKDKIVSLPIHSEMDEETIDYLFNCILKYFKG